MVKDNQFEITFLLPDAASPKEWGINNDERKLAVAFRAVHFDNLGQEPLSNLSLEFGNDSNDFKYIVSGFCRPEDGFRWTNGDRAVLRFPAHDLQDDLEASFDLIPLLNGDALST